ncbi:ArsR/SmtB family transcription factor [Agromyces silvae]|uniref:ArsR/SmtB family transcription factor n=1 Tax=Agromyces silvae TaxID=3388266 RepID=UPI00280BC47F|nr:metalloregulator ArsR/SmtB family transcription factor [Agromyces protaetiae]
MHALDVIGDPVRRRILELLADGEVAAGEVGRIVQAEFGISQPAVSQHLRVLREAGFATVRPEGTRRLYTLDPAPIAEAAQWFTPFERFWRGPLDALGTELARGARARRRAAATQPSRVPEASAREDPAAPERPEAPRRPTRPQPPTPSTTEEH